MPLLRVCTRHQVTFPAGSRCPACAKARAKADAPRRARRNQELGRNSQHWRRLSRRAIANAHGVCPDCRRAETKDDPASKLTADLVAGGDHSRARLEDVRVRCRRCHGRAQGSRDGGVSRDVQRRRSAELGFLGRKLDDPRVVTKSSRDGSA